MELRDLANQILYGCSLDSKINGPTAVIDLSDSDPGTPLIAAPDLPGRPEQLAFDRRKSHNGQFQGTANVNDPKSRGLILHYFANHELLAIEIMALALLRFTDAPAAFRLGIARTILEEQEHLKLYVNRMSELNVEFGDLPLNSFFWRTMKDIDSPSQYAAAMSMTFEQANLDFALHYEAIFKAAGDETTASILRKIHDDEIRHVAHGVIWMQRFHNQESLWTAYNRHLNFPLTPSRAKGPIFDTEGRRRAGIDEEFIRELQVFSSSKGRPPDLWIFNPGCEREVSTSAKNPFLNGEASFIETDLAPLLMFLAAPDDAVIVAKKPPHENLLTLKEAGFQVPELLETRWPPKATEIVAAVRGRKFARLRPWAATRGVLHWRQPLNKNLRQRNVEYQTPEFFFNKAWLTTIATESSQESADTFVGQKVTDTKHLKNFAAILSERDITHLAVKPLFGASGLGLKKLQINLVLASSESELAQKIKFPILAEPWYDKIIDLSIQFEVEAPNKIRVLDVTRPLIDEFGRYCGHGLGRPFTFPDASGDDLTAEFFTNLYPAWLDQLREEALAMGSLMAQHGFSGAAGIDAMVYRDRFGKLQLRPVVEVNPRLTMGRVAIALDRKIARGTPAIWAHLRLKDIRKHGYQSFVEFSRMMHHKYSSSLNKTQTYSKPVNQMISHGYIETTPAENAKGILTALFAGQDAAQYAWKLLNLTRFPD